MRNEGKDTNLANGSESENIGRQRNAAKDFLQLGSTHLAKEQGRVEVVDYYLYKGPTGSEPKAFDSSLLPGEGVTEEGHPAENPRQAYCVLALGLEGCPASSISQSAVTSSITSKGGTLSAIVNPNGLPTKYLFEYGATEAYGKTTTTTALANVDGKQNVTAALSGLEPCTTYHYQAEAENKVNEVEGKPGLGGDETFDTVCKGTARIRVSLVHKENTEEGHDWIIGEQIKAKAGALQPVPPSCKERVEKWDDSCLEKEVVSVSREIPEGYGTTGEVIPSSAATKLGAWLATGYGGSFGLELNLEETAVIEEFPLKAGGLVTWNTYEYEIEWEWHKE